MRVCLVNPPWEDNGRWGIRAGCRFPNLMPRKHNSYVPFPFLLAYTGAYLESSGVDVLLIDGVAERCDTPSFLARIRLFSPDLVVAETASTSLAHDLELLSQVKSENPSAHVTLYGPHVSVLPQDALISPAVDSVALGEPEHTIRELVESLGQGKGLERILGLAYREADGAIRFNPRRPLIQDLDSLPYPKRAELPMERYSVPGFPSPVVFMYASRGCPHRCTFCLWPQTIFEKGNYRPRAPERIVEEMAHVLDEFPSTRSVFFDDDTFNIGRDRLIRFADELDRRKIRIPWGMNARADHWDRELLERLAATGLFTLRLGIESGDQAVLDTCGKALNLEDARNNLHLAHEVGIRNHVSFMIGLAAETPDSVEKTIRFAKSIPADSVQFSVAVPFPGTDYHRYVEAQGFLVTRDYRLYSGSDNAVMRTEAMSAEEIRHAIVHARRRVYFSPRFIARRLRYVRDPRDLLAIVRKVTRLLVRH
jgi:radical SAM superfamily enzyme YgiQ (UPF0313 family)